MEKRITKRENFASVLEIVTELGRGDLVDFINHEIELLDKKASKKTQTKTQKENETFIETIYEVLVDLAKPATINEIQNANETIAEFSNQKVSALLKKLVDAKRVVKVVEKNKTYFSVAN